MHFAIYVTLPGSLWAWSPLTSSLPDGEGRPKRESDLTANCERTV
jgi:hypothetical protein